MIYNQINHGYGYLKMSLSGLSARKDKTFALIRLNKMQQQSQANSQFKNISFEIDISF